MNARVGWGAGVVGFALLFIAQIPAALGAAALFPLVGVITGLGMAKWLQRPWYGRQFRAGLRAGTIAAGGGAAGLLLSALLTAPRSMAELALRSHLLGLQMRGQVYALRGIGWVGATIVFALIGGTVCVLLAGLITQAFAFDKSRHAILVVDRAREAAQRSNRVTAFARPTRRMLPTPPAGMLLGQSADWHATLAPAPNPWAESLAPSGPLDPGGAQNRELHEALAAWAGTTGAPPSERNDAAPAVAPDDAYDADDAEAPPPEKKPGNWLC
jgi:hypothetical protein